MMSKNVCSAGILNTLQALDLIFRELGKCYIAMVIMMEKEGIAYQSNQSIWGSYFPFWGLLLHLAGI